MQYQLTIGRTTLCLCLDLCREATPPDRLQASADLARRWMKLYTDSWTNKTGLRPPPSDPFGDG